MTSSALHPRPHSRAQQRVKGLRQHAERLPLLEGAALDAVEDVLGTLVGVEKAPDDVVPSELNMFAALRERFLSFAREFLRGSIADPGPLLDSALEGCRLNQRFPVGRRWFFVRG